MEEKDEEEGEGDEKNQKHPSADSYFIIYPNVTPVDEENSKTSFKNNKSN